MGTLPFPGPAAQADQLMQPAGSPDMLQEIRKEDLGGRYQIHLRVNPDLPFDRNVTMQLSETLFPVLLERYAIGARLLFKHVWEINGQKDFEMIWPPIVAELETQMRFGQVLMQTMAMQQAMQGPPPPQGEPPPSPETTQALEGAQQAQAGAEMAGAEHQTQQAQLRTQQMQMQTQQGFLKILEQQQRLVQHAQAHAQQLSHADEAHRQHLALKRHQARQQRNGPTT